MSDLIMIRCPFNRVTKTGKTIPCGHPSGEGQAWLEWRGVLHPLQADLRVRGLGAASALRITNRAGPLDSHPVSFAVDGLVRHDYVRGVVGWPP